MTAPLLVDVNGAPLSSNGHAATAKTNRLKSFSSSIDSYMASLSRLDLSPIFRARDPFSNHAWVNAAATKRATVGTLPLLVYRETDAATEGRRLKTKAAGRPWTGPRAGSDRRAFERYVAKSAASRFFIAKSAKPDYDHPLMGVLTKPNPILSGSQLVWLTLLWLAVKGEFFWLPTDEQGDPVPIGTDPAMLWPIPPDVVEEGHTGASGRGDLIGWWISPPDYLPTRLQKSRRFFVEVDSVIQFKFPDPSNPIRGMSKLSAAASAIESDMIAHAHNRSLLRNQGTPKGVFEFDGVLDADQEADVQKKFKVEHRDVENRGGIPILQAGLRWKTTGLSPADLEYFNLLGWDRDEILALMDCHKAVLGVTSELNRATMEAGVATLWQMAIIPDHRVIESTLESTLFFAHPDDVFAMFDYSGVDALRIGMAEKITAADQLCGERLHVPPRTAMIAVGLSDSVGEYPEEDTAFVSALATPIDVAVESAREPIPEPAPVPPAAAPADEDEPMMDEEEEAAALKTGEWKLIRRGVADPNFRPILWVGESVPRKAPAARTAKQTAAQRRRRWIQFVRLQGKLEADMGRRWRAWVRSERGATLGRFDQEAGSGRALLASIRSVIVTKDLRLSAVLPDLDESGRNLKARTRPNRAASLDATYTFTLDDIGIPTFAIDDAALIRHFDLRERILAQSAPDTLRTRLFDSLQAGVQAGETVQQLRSRVAEVYDIAAGAPKTLMVARTETASFMNGIRDEMFGLQGITSAEWISAGDEHVRPNHVTFGSSGPKPRGFNYLTLVGSGGGSLLYPGDSNAPAGEVISCRCLSTPVE